MSSNGSPEPEPEQTPTTLTVHMYDYQEFDDYGQYKIVLWCLDRHSKAHKLIIPDFTPTCYLELPITVNNRPFEWTRQKAQIIIDQLNRKLNTDTAEHAPCGWIFVKKPKLYYYQGDTKYPMIMLKFNSMEALNHCVNSLKFPLKIRNFPDIPIKVWENKISSIRKLLTNRKCGFSQWFTIVGVEELMNNARTPTYTCAWQTLTPIPPEQTSDWVSSPTMLAFDIECYSDNPAKFPNAWDSKHVITMISAIFQRVGDHSTRKRYVFLLGDCNQPTLPTSIPVRYINDKKEEEWVEEPNRGDLEVVVKKYNNDIKLIDGFCDLINELDPEIITGYNIYDFDFQYIWARLDRRAQEFKPMGKCGEPTTIKNTKWKSSGFGLVDVTMTKMPGRISIDVFNIIKRDHKLDSYRLTHASRKFLGEKRDKHDVSPAEMFAIHEQMQRAIPGTQGYQDALANVTRVVEYCIQDSELVIDLFESLNVWISLVELSSIVGVTIVDLYTRGQQIRCLSQIYDLMCREGYVMDTRPAKKEKFTGGYVGDPIPGLHENIICLDFASLYPSIIQAYNICYTTLLPEDYSEGDGGDVIPHELFEVDKVMDCEEDMGLDDDAIMEGGYQRSSGASEEKKTKGRKKKKEEPKMEKIIHRFVTKDVKLGVLPMLVKSLVDARREVRKKLDGVKDKDGNWIIPKEKDPVKRTVLNARQLGIKCSANSVYGFLGVSGGVLPLSEGSRVICATGRRLIGEVNDYLVAKYGATVVYGDSVSEDTPVLVKYGSDKICYRRIADLVQFLPEDNIPEDVKSSGKEEKIPDDLEVWSDQGWTQIKKVIRHKTDKQMYRVLTHTGCIDVTEDHSLLDPTGKEVRPGEVKVGDKLLHKELPVIDMVDTITEELAWVWGLFYAEGSCGTYNCPSGVKSSWAISNQDVTVLTNAQDILNRYYTDFTFKICYCMESSACNKLQVAGSGVKMFVDEYRKLFYTGVSDCTAFNSYKIVPDAIMCSSIPVKTAFLNGYYEGDGFKPKGRGISNRRFDNKGKIGSAGLFYLARSIGYKVSLNCRTDKMDVFRCNLTHSYQRKPANIIKKIIPLPKCTSYVYDLETANHHFSAGIGEMVVHNTDSTMVDLNITDPAECNAIGRKLSEEISGNPEKGIVGLFPPPLKMEFEKAMRILCLCKKKYAAALIDDKGNHKLKPMDLLTRGIILARRDNCKWVQEVYVDILMNILTKKSIKHSYDRIVDAVQDLTSGNVDYKKLVMIKTLGGNYKSNTYFMKVFADALKRQGKTPNPGERLEYLVVVPHADAPQYVTLEGEEPISMDDLKLGERMRLVDTYLQYKEMEPIDYMYYLDHLMENPIDQLFYNGYRKILDVWKTHGSFGYKSQKRKRCKLRPIDNPVEMLSMIIKDNMCTFEDMKNIIPKEYGEMENI